MPKEIILEQFGANAADYASSDVHARGASLARLYALVGPQAEWEVLDVATGAGHTALTFAPHVRQVTAVDITPEMLAQAQKLAAEKTLKNIIFELADAGALPYFEASFDLVTCRIAPHHFPDIVQFIREALRVLKPGGILAIVDNVVPPGPIGNYINAFEKLRDPSHARCWSLEDWLNSFNELGLTIIHQELLAKRLKFDFWAQRHDSIMLDYLHALLFEGGTQVNAFLQPQTIEGELSFRLVEGIVLGQKAA